MSVFSALRLGTSAAHRHVARSPSMFPGDPCQTFDPSIYASRDLNTALQVRLHQLWACADVNYTTLRRACGGLVAAERDNSNQSLSLPAVPVPLFSGKRALPLRQRGEFNSADAQRRTEALYTVGRARAVIYTSELLFHRNSHCHAKTCRKLKGSQTG